MAKLFGTDGIRGIFGESITGDIAYCLGNALARNVSLGTIVVGRDTRVSGLELYKYLKKGILDGGADIVNLSIASTPLIAYATKHINASFGVAITASHNSKEYNGLKVLNSNGAKIDDATIDTIEHDMKTTVFVAQKRGIERDGVGEILTYENTLKGYFSEISGLNIGIDTTNGALSHLATRLFSSLNVESHFINNEGDGKRINEHSGALHPETIRDIVLRDHLDMGCAFDGDGDRIVLVSSSGRIINGDLMLYAISHYLKDRGKLANNLVIGTIYTNMGVEKAMNANGISVERSDVGDSNVATRMALRGAVLGGERAGHIILSEYSPTGDGLLIALYMCKIMLETGKSLDELTDVAEYPIGSFDMMTNRAREIEKDEKFLVFLDGISEELKSHGRYLVRASGTENKLRIMVECVSANLVENYGNMIVDFVRENYIKNQ